MWWCITRSKVKNFEGFMEIFTEKHWRNERQEHVRDDLEYGRFIDDEQCNTVQYLVR